MARRLYPAVLEHGARNTFAVWFPDFPDCVAGGHTREEAIEKAERLVAQEVDALTERDVALPEPTPLETIELPKGSRFIAFLFVGVEPPDPSERVNIYLPKSLIVRADKRAAEYGMSRSSFFGLVVSMAVEGPSLGGSLMAFGLPRSKVKLSERPSARKRRS